MDPSLPQQLPDGTWNYAASPFGMHPNTNLAIMGATVFALLFLTHAILAIIYKTKYMIAATIGCALETIGYSLRILAIDDPFSTPKFSVQVVLIIIAPILMAATQYVMLEKIIHYSYPEASPVKHTLITKVFVVSDVVTFFVQAGGSIIFNSHPEKTELGVQVLMVGLCIQMVSFAVFLALAMVYYSRALKIEQGKAGMVLMGNTPEPPAEKWKRIFATLMFTSGLVFIRSVFRVVEFADGFS
ncbi:RTA1 like protein-domain-containing protein [Obelidium mucronatum]|nr:RTA1 like protein-domain-containing protein [Obelidium mucronatum]